MSISSVNDDSADQGKLVCGEGDDNDDDDDDDDQGKLVCGEQGSVRAIGSFSDAHLRDHFISSIPKLRKNTT